MPFLGGFGVPLIAAGASAGIQALGNRQERRALEGRMETAQTQRQRADERYESGMELLNQRRGSADEEAGRSTRDRFGEELQRIEDTSMANVNATRQALSRASMAGGGDTTGTTGVQMLQAQQEGNQQIGDAHTRFANINERISSRERQRGDQLASQRFRSASRRLEGAEQDIQRLQGLDTRRRMANRQFLQDAIGMGANVYAAGQEQANS